MLTRAALPRQWGRVVFFAVQRSCLSDMMYDKWTDHLTGGTRFLGMAKVRIPTACAVLAVLAVLLALPVQFSVAGLQESNVLVLYNADSPESTQIANYYQQVHPNVTLWALGDPDTPEVEVSMAEQVSADYYQNTIRPQVLQGLAANPNIECIVTTKGLPLRIYNSNPNPGSYTEWRGAVFSIPIFDSWWEPYSSLESELARIDDVSSWEQMGDQAYFMSPPTFPFPTDHHASNPYYDQDGAFSSASYEGIRLTARLDGFTVDDVIAAIDRAQQVYVRPDGQFVVLDDDPNAPAADIDRMSALRDDVLTPAGQAFVHDDTDAAITDAPGPVIGYVSHGVNDGSGGLASGYIADQLDFDLANGAVFHTYESFNAYSFDQGGNVLGQALLAEWLAAGGTVGVGNVEEPTAGNDMVANEDILFDMLLNGYTWAEAAWSSLRQLSFVNTVVGDPLMVFQPWVTGDMNGDGVVDDLDIDLLHANLSGADNAASSPIYDLDGDGDADSDDVDYLVLTVLDTRYGDFNLDLIINVGDLTRLAVNYHHFGGWADGDANGDGFINLTDMVIMATSFGHIGGTGGTTPEPATLGLLAIGGLALLIRKRR